MKSEAARMANEPVKGILKNSASGNPVQKESQPVDTDVGEDVPHSPPFSIDLQNEGQQAAIFSCLLCALFTIAVVASAIVFYGNRLSEDEIASTSGTIQGNDTTSVDEIASTSGTTQGNATNVTYIAASIQPALNEDDTESATLDAPPDSDSVIETGKDGGFLYAGINSAEAKLNETQERTTENVRVRDASDARRVRVNESGLIEASAADRKGNEGTIVRGEEKEDNVAGAYTCHLRAINLPRHASDQGTIQSTSMAKVSVWPRSQGTSMSRRCETTPTTPRLQTTTTASEPDKRSILAPLLSSVLGVALTLSVITISLTVLHYRSSGSGIFGLRGSSWNTCNSKLCLNHFRRLRDSLNRTIDPCEDFYRFACGSWQPRVAVAQTAFRDLLAVAQLDAIRYLGAAHNQNQTLPQGKISVPDSQPIQLNKAERSYRVCLYSQSSEVALLREFLANRSLSWPERPTSPAQPLDILLDLDINWNLGLWFSIRLVPVPGHSKRMIRIGPGIVSTAWKKALDDLVLKGVYTARLRKFYNVMRTTNFVSMSDKDLEAHLRDESIIMAALSDTTSSGQSELAFPLKQMQKLATPNLRSSHWLSLLNWHLKKRHRVSEADRVLVTNVKLLRAVDGLLQSLSVESVLQQLAWTLVQLLGWMADPSLPGRPVTAHMAEPRHADCLWAANRAFGLTLLSSHIDAKYPLATRAAVDGILEGIKQTTVNLFLKTPWIDAESRDAAIDKLRGMNTSLWPADAYLNASEISAILQPFPDPSEPVFRSWLDALTVRRALLRNRNIDAVLYSEDMQSQRALFRYHYYVNELAVSLQALTSPLYVDGGGLAVNIGGLGAHYAATLARAFDPRGVLIDGGGLATGLWWGKSSYQEYERRTTCPAVDDDDDEGSEGFAGVAAIEIAYASFNASRNMDNRGRSRSRRAFLGLTEDQAFFVSFCQAFCSHDPSERQKLACTVPLKSSRAFAAAFTCPVASAMNPAARCGFFEGEGRRGVGAFAATKTSRRSPLPGNPHQTIRGSGSASSPPPTPFGMNMF